MHKKHLRGTLKIKADCVNISQDSIKIHFLGNLVSKKFFCCGFDNPYLLIERARLLTTQEIEDKKKKERDALTFTLSNLSRKLSKRQKSQMQANINVEVENTVKNIDKLRDWVRVH